MHSDKKNLLGGHFRKTDEDLHLILLYHEWSYYERKTYQNSDFSSFYEQKNLIFIIHCQKDSKSSLILAF